MHIKKMMYGGAGVSEAGAYVPFTLPGELVEVAVGQLTKVVEASSSRVDPRCVHFRQCGGCHYQHAEYAAQIEIKLGIVREILGRGSIEVVTGEPWGYRNRIRLRVETVEGQVRVGYSWRGSNTFLHIVECPIAAPVLWRTAAALSELDGEVMRRVAEVEIFCSGDEARVQLSLYLRQPVKADSLDVFCRDLKARVPELAGAGAALHQDAHRRARKAWTGAAWGDAGIVYEAAGLRYWVSRGAFFQVNRFLVDDLVTLVADRRAGALAWDLYAGVGLFSRALALNFESVVAVEGSPVSSACLRQAGPNVAALQVPTLEFLRTAVLGRERPELVVLDPPRAGVGREVCGLLGRVGAAELIYVSCDPVTLGLDLEALSQAGYDVERVVLVDMFPQTFHIETVTTLRRRPMDREAMRV